MARLPAPNLAPDTRGSGAVTPMRRKRAVIVCRLSKDRDESTSVARQEEKGRAWCVAFDVDVAGVAIDVDVSGSMSPWERPELGPWLQRPGDFEVLVIMKLDRLSRSTKDFLEMLEWAEAHGIEIVATDDGIDLTTDIGKMVAKILSIFAEFELKTITRRILDAKMYNRNAGKWNGGIAPFWCEDLPDENGQLVLNDFRTAKTYEMIDWVQRDADPMPVAAVAEKLTDEKIMPGQARRDLKAGREPKIKVIKTKNGERKRTYVNPVWDPQSVWQILRSPTLKGVQTTRGEIVRNPDTGMPVMVAPPLLTDAEWDKLQDALDRAAARHGRKGINREPSPLQRLVDCGDCSGTHYYQKNQSRTSPGQYRCSSHYKKSTPTCDSKAIDAAYLHDMVSESVMDRVGHIPRIEVSVAAATDHSREIEQVLEAVKHVRSERDLGLYDYPGGDEEYTDRLTKLINKRKSLEEKHDIKPSVTIKPLGGTFGDWWTDAPWPERRTWLVDRGIKITASRISDARSSSVGVAVAIDWGDLEELETAARQLQAPKKQTE